MANFSRYLTVTEVLNFAATESGLTPITDPLGSQDASFVQLRTLLTFAGRELVTAYPWQILRREGTRVFNYGDASTIALPDGFDRLIDQTAWERDRNTPVGGPFSPQEWQAIQGAAVTLLPATVSWYLDQDVLRITPSVPATGTDPYATIYYHYISRGWVRDGTTSTIYRDYPSAGADFVLYDPTLIVKLLKLRFLGAKGFDTTDISNQVTQAFQAAVSKDTPGSVLSLDPYGSVTNQSWLINGGLN